MTNLRRQNRLNFIAACYGMLLFGIVMTSLGTIVPELQTRFELDNAGIGQLLSLLPFGILMGSLGFGPMVDRFGYQKLLFTGCLITLLSFIGLALSNNESLLIFIVVILGGSGGALNGATNALVSDISTENHGANLSLLGVFYGIGALSTPVIMASLQQIIGFQEVVLTMGIVLSFPMLGLLFITFPSPKQKNGFPIKDGIKMLSNPVILLFGFILFLQSGLEGITNNWTAFFLQEDKGLGLEKALYTLSTFVVGLTITRLLLGKILRKIQPITILQSSMVLVIIAALALSVTDSETWFLICFFFLGAGFASGFPVVLGYAGERFAQLSGTAFSIIITIALIGNLLSNYALGVLSEAYGIFLFPGFIAVLSMAMLILLLMSKKQIINK